MSGHRPWFAAQPTTADEEDGPFGCCNVCLNRQTEECDDCNDADLFELDDELIEEGALT